MHKSQVRPHVDTIRPLRITRVFSWIEGQGFQPCRFAHLTFSQFRLRVDS
jgi:hypothetical protein